MNYLIGIVVFIIGLLLSIALHEIGHMVPAKKFGVRVAQYMVGFGPTLFSRVKGDTEYGFKAIPLGGYIRMVGMVPPGKYKDKATLEAIEAEEASGTDGFPPEPTGAGTKKLGLWGQIADGSRAASAAEIEPGDENRVFYKLSTPKKLIVMLGGPTMNLIIAFVLITIVFCGIGQSVPTTSIEAVVTDSAAQAAGVQPGDKVLSVGGQSVESWSDFTTIIKDSPNQTEDMVVERDGQQVTLSITPQAKETEEGTVGVAGVYTQTANEPIAFSEVPSAVWSGVSQTAGSIIHLPQMVWTAAADTFSDTPRDPSNSAIGPVGIARLSGESVSSDTSVSSNIARLLSLLASLNIALFVFNLIPLLPLDGGHAAGALWEGAKRTWARIRKQPLPKPFDISKTMPVAYIMFVVFGVMALVLVYADLVNPVTLS